MNGEAPTMRHAISRYRYTHTDERGYACFEDEHSRNVCIPMDWLPKEASPGATFTIAHVAAYLVSSLSVELDLESELPNPMKLDGPHPH